jgi:hypothetical protein
VFAAQEDRADLFVRTIATARASTRVSLTNVLYNLKRLLFLQRIKVVSPHPAPVRPQAATLLTARQAPKTSNPKWVTPRFSAINPLIEPFICIQTTAGAHERNLPNCAV